MSNEILDIALTQYGIREIVGKRDNPAVLKYFDILSYDGSRLKDETAWCSAFVNWVAIKANRPFSGKLNARSWLKVGRRVMQPSRGDVAVFWRESPSSWKGHVGIFIREENGLVYVLGGNQNNEVNITGYPKKKLLEYRRL